MADLLKGLNEPQRQGVITTEGPVLILAGAGSGKTRVLTHRVAYLLAEKGVNPWNIMAITFTNKAAGEMRERINGLVGEGAEAIWVATFHSSCVRILRRFGDRIGYNTNFSIYDTDDSKSVMKEVCKRLEIDTKVHKEKSFLNLISSLKNELISPEQFLATCGDDYMKKMQGMVYREYQSRLQANNAMDFDDLIMKTVEMLKINTDVLVQYQQRFLYLMVDEYQDTNTAQFELIRLLSGGHRNLCVVGDDDQSIYKFRGANIYNILNFEDHFPEAAVIKLEQNYRSTSNILDAANSVIANNKGRKEKRLWTEKEEGPKVRYRQFDSGYEEAAFLAADIASQVYQRKYTYSQCAILYRTNAQSRMIEEKFLLSNIPYRIVGGVNFYSRKEVKDLLAYLKVIDNAADEVAVKRIINVPKRGIGAASLSKVDDYAYQQGIGFFRALQEADRIPTLGRGAAKIAPFTEYIGKKRELVDEILPSDLLNQVIEEIGYMDLLREEGEEEAKARKENIDELITKVVTYEEEAETPTLSGFLEEVALVADIDSLNNEEEYVTLMTLHAAKGLEYPNVYIAGMEDGLFPSEMCIADDPSELEEERRLCYVGITRAMDQLTLTGARMRMIRGQMQYGAVSRFVKEIPPELIDGTTYEYVRKDPFDYEEKPSAPRESLKNKPLAAQTYKARNFGTKIEKQPLDYGVGDRVKHVKFGEGQVTAINEGGRDFEVTVDFDQVGTKKMFASFAKLQKL